MNIHQIVTVLATIVMLMGIGGMLIYSTIYIRTMDESIKLRIPPFILLVFLSIMIIIFSSGISTIEKAESIDRSEYTYYLDGTEVNSNTIDISLYDYKYDDEKRVVYLTHKAPDNDNGILGWALGWSSGFFTGNMMNE